MAVPPPPGERRDCHVSFILVSLGRVVGFTYSFCIFSASIKAFADGGANQVHRIVGDNLEK